MKPPVPSRNTTANLLENLKVTVSGTMLKSNLSDWIRTDEVPRYNRMYFFTSGAGTIQLNGRTYEPKPNQLFILPAGTVQTFTTRTDDPYIRYYCDFYATVGEWPLLQAADQAFWAQVRDPEDVRRTFEELTLHFRRASPASYLRTQAALIRLISICMEDGGYGNFLESLLVTPEQHKLTLTLNHIQNRLAEPLTVDGLAELVHFHPNYFIAFFKKHMGISPMQFVQRQRLEEAKRLLGSTELPVSEIAAAVGMDFMNFSKQFKRAIGLSPSVYRSSAR
ncbi:helix-turn-helix domain-containing protein [Gorillibacterium sp. sgz5001074]|uniref:AraC family transcriptional regulator n=1 Tax=Gorillibacterium sp. sgz5001074 TaxID=3446695 RepID=UPI003F66CCDF